VRCQASKETSGAPSEDVERVACRALGVVPLVAVQTRDCAYGRRRESTGCCSSTVEERLIAGRFAWDSLRRTPGGAVARGWERTTRAGLTALGCRDLSGALVAPREMTTRCLSPRDHLALHMWDAGARGLRVVVGLVVCLSLAVGLVRACAASAEVGSILWTPQGDLWFTEPAANEIGEIRPNATVIWFKARTAGDEGRALSLGPGGGVWFAGTTARAVGRIASTGALTEFTVPLPPVLPSSTGSLGLGLSLGSSELPGPGSISAGPDGNMWFTNGGSVAGVSSVYGGQIDRITPAGTVSEYQIPSPNSQPNGLVAGPDGNLWFTESTLHGGAIGHITPGGTITTLVLPEVHEQVSETFGIAAGREDALWFTEQLRGSNPWTSRIGRVTPGGDMSYFALPRSEVQADDIALGADGDMWFTAGGSDTQRPGSSAGSEIGRITPDGQVSEFAIDSEPNEIVRGPDSEMLFTLLTGTGNKIGRITTSGKVSEIELPSPDSCFVPRVAGQTPRAAQRMLARAHCGLGKITRRTGATRKPVVVRQRPSPETTLTEDARVAIEVG
jgi:streptogramin lyase